MPIDPIERHNLIMQAGKVIGLATALQAILAADEDVLQLSPFTTAAVLKVEAENLQQAVSLAFAT